MQIKAVAMSLPKMPCSIRGFFVLDLPEADLVTDLFRRQEGTLTTVGIDMGIRLVPAVVEEPAGFYVLFYTDSGRAYGRWSAPRMTTGTPSVSRDQGGLLAEELSPVVLECTEWEPCLSFDSRTWIAKQ